MALPKKLKNFILFNDGRGYLGEVPEVQLPKLSRKTEDYRAGGMSGPIKLDNGMEGLELEWTAAGYLREVFAQFGTLKHDGVALRFTGACQAEDEAVMAIEVVARGRHIEIDPGKAKPGDNTEMKVKTALSYYKLSIDGKPVIEVDLVNMVEVVDGVDRLAEIRKALGI
ncbi:MAG: phage major tail tube protein [Roseateles depolymerans]|uniref:Phage major tail tube protein n=1 Tax=Roseateles depolymerans TaxID=76731 RepID=A0A2W5DEX1_9BURK|nr:MAG: phage major tail tube protein [Roseateles depolymerans]